jgi:uncharacterized membrane protein
MATALVVWAIMDRGRSAPIAALAYFGWIGAFYYWYRRRRPDLFMLAGGLLSLIVAVVAFLSRNVWGGSGEFLLIGMVVIAMSAGGAFWLKSIVREQRS